MNRIKELREEKDVSKEELAKVLRLNIKEYSKKENTDFYPNELEKLAIRLDVPRSYLNGNTNYLSKGEREYRKKIKEAAKKNLKILKLTVLMMISMMRFLQGYLQWHNCVLRQI